MELEKQMNHKERKECCKAVNTAHSVQKQVVPSKTGFVTNYGGT